MEDSSTMEVHGELIPHHSYYVNEFCFRKFIFYDMNTKKRVTKQEAKESDTLYSF
jgi:hypothetical protein